MSEWILCDSSNVLELGDNPHEVIKRVLSLVHSNKLSTPNAIASLGSPDSPNRPAVAFGINGDRAYLEFGNTDNDPPYIRVVAPDVPGESTEELSFKYLGEPTFIAARNCVSIPEMERALKHFVTTESVPDWLTVEEV